MNYFIQLIILCFLIVSTSLASTLPLRIVSWNLSPVEKSITVPVSNGAKARSLYLQIHNIRFGGQVSVKINNGEWFHIYNDNVNLYEMERRHDGIGGINATIRMDLPLPLNLVRSGNNRITIRLNGTDNVTTAIRVIDINFKDQAGDFILLENTFAYENPATWPILTPSAADLLKGEVLWKGQSKQLINDPLTKAPIRGSCSSCHFDDGSDLKYFNFSNESIIARSRFHGLSYKEGEYIASYIRTRNTPNPAQPWDPPFQPGAGLDPKPSDSARVKLTKARHWMGGAGLDAVADDEKEIIDTMFPGGVSWAKLANIMDHDKTLSAREIPVPVQMPDWNMWLPDIAPEDLWNAPEDHSKPNQIYQNTLNKLLAEPIQTLADKAEINNIFGQYTNDLERWLGGYRVRSIPIDTPTLQKRSSGLTREDVLMSISRWRAVKMAGLMRKFDLESIQDDQSVWRRRGKQNFTNEVMHMPGITPRANVWQIAPHIISHDTRHFENQWWSHGQLESNQWYILQLIINGGNRIPGPQNIGVDWNYLYIHYRSAFYETGGLYSPTNLVNQIKLLQLRNTGKGIGRAGFDAEVTSPIRFFSNSNGDPIYYQDALKKLSPNLWRMAFEEYLHEWLDVVESINVNDDVLMQRMVDEVTHFEPKTSVPRPWNGRDTYFDDVDRKRNITHFYRLLPKMAEADIDELLIADFAERCNLIWPYNSARWGSVPSWKNNFEKKAIFTETFETSSPFNGFTQFRIKSTNGVNNGLAPKNGGQSFVAATPIGDAITTKISSKATNIRIPLDTHRLKFRIRSAFNPYNYRTSKYLTFDMGVQFNNSARVYYAPTAHIVKPLFNRKFQSYEKFINVPTGATRIVKVVLRWRKDLTASGGSIFIDNVSITPIKIVPTTRDTTPPPAPYLGYNGGILKSSIRPSNRLNWSKPAASDIDGYYLYRWKADQPDSTKIKIFNHRFRDPYRAISDRSSSPGISYKYYVTALDKAGNESLPSNIVTIGHEDQISSKPPVAWLQVEKDCIVVGAIATSEIDEVNYRFYRKANDETRFSLMSTNSFAAEGIVYRDKNVSTSKGYQYYIESVDRNGKPKKSNTVSVGYSEEAEAFASPLGGYSSVVNRPLQHFSALSPDSIIKNSASVTAWNNLSSSILDASSVTTGMTFPSTSRTRSGRQGIDFKNSRQGFQLLNSTQQERLLNFSSEGAARTKSGFSVFIASKLHVLSSASRNTIIANHGNPSVTNSFGIRVDSSGQLEFFAGGNVIKKAGTNYVNGDTIVASFTYNSSNGNYTFWDAKTNNTQTGNLRSRLDLSSTQSLYVGTSQNSGQYWNGTINEIVLYDKKLSTQEILTNQKLLSSRWYDLKPHLTRVHQAEDFDLGINGKEYYDTTSSNIPAVSRTETSVDVETSTEGNYNVGYITAGEYLSYTVYVAEEGFYDFHFRMASSQATDKALSIYVNETKVGQTLSFNTGGSGWQDWKTYTLRNVPLRFGTQTLKIQFDTGEQNFNYFRVSKSALPTLNSWTKLGSYDEWQRKWDDHVGNPEDDDDNDGVLNLMEYALGANPVDASIIESEPNYMVTDSGIVLIHKMLKSDPSLNYSIELSETLNTSDWREARAVQIIEDSNDLLYNKVRYVLPKNRDKQFMRISIRKE